MDINSQIDLILEDIPKDSSGKWIATDDVRKAIYNILQPSWDHYSDLPSPSAYQQMKEDIQ